MYYQKQLPVAENAIVAKLKGVRGDILRAMYMRANGM